MTFENPVYVKYTNLFDIAIMTVIHIHSLKFTYKNLFKMFKKLLTCTILGQLPNHIIGGFFCSMM